MRPGPLALVSVLSAVIGAAIVIGVGSAFDWVGTSRTETIVAAPPLIASEQESPLPRPTAGPLPGDGFDAARIYEARADGVVTILAFFGETATGDGGQGSGFVVSDEGHILTSSHVITNVGAGSSLAQARAADTVYVEFRDGDRVPAEVVGWDVFDDVALLKVDPDAHELQPIPLGDSSEVVVGQPVAAIGSPFGNENSLGVGVVSATGRAIEALTSRYHLVDAIQIDAPLNRGNSGGPLLDARGNAIGINAQIRSDSGLAEGVGFAVPINAAKRSLEELLEDGEVSYAYVGVLTDELWPALARHLKLGVTRGALIAEVVDDGPAARAGLRGGSRTVVFQGQEVTVGGDIVLAVDGHPIERGDDLVRIVTNILRPGERSVFTVFRNGRRLNLSVTLAERPADPGLG
ncbi:MAG: trypsin-like peptidase domain-containing protein [Gaiellaceae bacterium]